MVAEEQQAENLAHNRLSVHSAVDCSSEKHLVDSDFLEVPVDRDYDYIPLVSVDSSDEVDQKNCSASWDSCSWTVHRNRSSWSRMTAAVAGCYPEKLLHMDMRLEVVHTNVVSVVLVVELVHHLLQMTLVSESYVVVADDCNSHLGDRHDLVLSLVVDHNDSVVFYAQRPVDHIVMLQMLAIALVIPGQPTWSLI